MTTTIPDGAPLFIVDLTYEAALEEIYALLDAHKAFLAKAYDDGVFLASGPKIPRTGGVILARSASAEALRALLAEDPFAKAGAARYALTAFRPSRTVSGLEGLL
ncbi:MAG: YciI family protein [Pseudomonadota bacterium]